jgi:hypothetical protein
LSCGFSGAHLPGNHLPVLPPCLAGSPGRGQRGRVICRWKPAWSKCLLSVKISSHLFEARACLLSQGLQMKHPFPPLKVHSAFVYEVPNYSANKSNFLILYLHTRPEGTQFKSSSGLLLLCYTWGIYLRIKSTFWKPVAELLAMLRFISFLGDQG